VGAVLKGTVFEWRLAGGPGRGDAAPRLVDEPPDDRSLPDANLAVAT